VVDSSEVVIPGYKVCTQYCDFINPANAAAGFGACGTGTTCSRARDGADLYPDCYPLNAAPPASCEVDSDCARGTGCNSGTCRKWCRVGVAADCSGGTCHVLTEPLLLGTVQYGFCY
jgi:hypothetical protein